ncbi:OmpA family protein [Mariprofundus ferrooxydans]|uniref:OmpA-like domain-containing protein n=1 Tax=Mariprofundus ferrooxydans PV-1 TaxID=314345 RepID=Q0F355_9PROT|nr:OmpA family protein [Mariprofundus ferrooxydans]EAU56086.1 hypothetical protein SPV1_04678 [Mariprofundus ferrooxydans PV-1]
MRWILPLILGTALISGCATDTPYPQQNKADASSKPVAVYGIAQETANGKERFVWCGACPSLTPKTAETGESPHKEPTPPRKANAVVKQWKPAAIIHFDFNSATIKPNEKTKLAGLFKDIGRNTTIILRGYTDAAGGMAYNQHLAWRRAQAVRRWLSEHLERQPGYEIRAFGKCCYARQPGLRPENRRVEIYIRKESKR